MTIVNDPAEMVLHSISGEVGTIAATVQAWLRANLAVGDEFYGVQYIRNAANPNRVTAFILFEDQP